MKCNEAMVTKEDYFDALLTRPEREAVEEHLAECESCRNAYRFDEQLLAALKDLPLADPPAPSFARQALRRGIAKAKQQSRKRISLSLGGALAACLTLWVTITIQTLQAGPFVDPEWQGVVVSLNRPKTINVLVTAPEDLKQAYVTIRLSSDLEMVGFPGTREISWHTNIRKGKNNLALPVLARKTGKAELVAQISHEKKNKMLRVKMLVKDDQSKNDIKDKRSAVT